MNCEVSANYIVYMSTPYKNFKIILDNDQGLNRIINQCKSTNPDAHTS